MATAYSLEPEEESVNLSAMTKAELLAYAESIGITGLSSSMTKAEIIAEICL